VAKPYAPYEGAIVSRTEARSLGLTRFYTGKPCKHGHFSERTTCNGGCITCNAISIASLYYAESPEKRAIRNARANARKDANREQVRAEGRAYSKANREKDRKWKRANRAKLNQLEREARLRDPERFKASKNKYLATDKGRVSCTAGTHRRRAKMRSAEGWFTIADVRRIGATQKWQCHWCGTPTRIGYHVDHVVPLSKGGSNWPSNLVIACAKCNQRKNATDPIEYARRIGLLI
jgi:5-methylcytosine-specific restriction endonuclease McrA